MSTTSYIPARDTDFDAWAQNFSTVIAASPATYGLLAGDAASITAAYTAWNAAYTLATNPATRTSPTIAAKDVQKASSLVVFRTYAQIIQNNAGVSDGAKSAAGLTVRATGRTPIPAPGTAPILGLVGVTPGVITFNYKDTSTPTTKAKPFGAIQLELWGDIPTTGSPSQAAARFLGLYTKSPNALVPVTGNVGKTIGLWARWTTRRGLVGPWSAELDVTIG